MEKTPLFKIEHLSCRYGDKPIVLHLEDLEIPRGELIFVLGKSGIGKSTFIETLGLMNKTIHEKDNPNVKFFPNSSESNNIELSDLWEKSDEDISIFRNQYFSFIFQNTNLMPNFTSGQNMCISQMIQGISFENAKEKVYKAMDDLDLPKDVFEKEITEISGGQRQRLAFVRAITSSFEVLFGDEPTGNLDRDTAHKLMNRFKKQIKNKNHTGIIVSHDIDLTMYFADRILLLTVNKTKGYGEVIKDNIMVRSNVNKDEWLVGKTIVQNPSVKVAQALKS